MTSSAERPAPLPRRLSDLLGMSIRFDDGHEQDQVIDVRLAPAEPVRGSLQELVVEGFIVGRPRPGTLFGYDRHPDQGPWIIRVLVRMLHSHTGYLEWGDVAQVDWQTRTLTVTRNTLRELQPGRSPRVHGRYRGT